MEPSSEYGKDGTSDYVTKFVVAVIVTSCLGNAMPLWGSKCSEEANSALMVYQLLHSSCYTVLLCYEVYTMKQHTVSSIFDHMAELKNTKR